MIISGLELILRYIETFPLHPPPIISHKIPYRSIDAPHPHRRHPPGPCRIQPPRSRERDEPPGKAGL